MSSYGRTPEQEEEQRRLMALPFRVVIEEVFTIKGRGLIVIGRVQTGVLREGDPIIITGKGNPIQAHAMRFLPFGRLDYVSPDENIGILLSKNVSKDQLESGMIITTEGL